jgi:hypothetical protein
LSLLKVRRFIASGLRLRTACDFAAEKQIEVKAPAAFTLPGEPALLGKVKAGILACTGLKLFASPAITVIQTVVVKKEPPATPAAPAASPAPETETVDPENQDADVPPAG